ncbi:hypothetical protein, partial [Deinococcus multiflagellatus]|uniref:hypothetical protein n=1 Tax=Deinococcus multiflagellatus TaxID=1656887 RepID=UPI001CD02863
MLGTVFRSVIPERLSVVSSALRSPTKKTVAPTLSGTKISKLERSKQIEVRAAVFARDAEEKNVVLQSTKLERL